jgi:hypothetical protein
MPRRINLPSDVSMRLTTPVDVSLHHGNGLDLIRDRRRLVHDRRIGAGRQSPATTI